MKRFVKYAIVILCLSLIYEFQIRAQQTSVFIEDLTWKEVRDQIAAGKSTAIYFTGSTEQNGSHLVLGKHNYISRYVAERIARELGNALVYPIMPFAPTGDPLTKSDHMRYAGSISLSDNILAAVAHDVTLSAISAGFKNVFIMGDHGGGQEVLESVTASLDSVWAPKGAHVYYIPDVYYKAKKDMREYLLKHDLPPDVHAGIDDTSELLFIDKDGSWVRKEEFKTEGDDVKREEGVAKASQELGEIFIGYKIKNAVDQIHSLLSKK